jgi:hypothetical protein
VINAQSFTIVIANIKNPASAASTSSFAITTYYENTDDTIVATGTIGGLISTAAAIDSSSITISPSSAVVLRKTSTYTVSIKIVHPIPIGGSVKMYFPKDIVLNEVEVPNNC